MQKIIYNKDTKRQAQKNIYIKYIYIYIYIYVYVYINNKKKQKKPCLILANMTKGKLPTFYVNFIKTSFAKPKIDL